MDERTVFVIADRYLDGVVGQIRPEQWAQTVPESFQRRMDMPPPTLREIVNYHAYDDIWVPDMLAGRTMAEVGEETHKGDLLGEDPVAAFGAIVDQACAAAEALDDLDRPVHCSFGDYPAREYFWQITMFRGLRGHDIAAMIGADTAMPDDLVQGLWEQLTPNAEAWREIGIFPAAVPVADDAPLQDRLFGLTGRQPD